MAHPAQNKWFEAIKKAHPGHFQWSNVLEIGSLDINGSVRGLFEYANYVGFDVGLGPAVDYAVYGEDIRYQDNSFDVTLSSECFEHAEGWATIFDNMVRMTRPGGLVIFTCAGTNRPEHGTTRSDIGSSPLTVAEGIDYYGNLTPEDFERECADSLAELDYKFLENTTDYDLYFAGIKRWHSPGGNLTPLQEINWSRE